MRPRLAPGSLLPLATTGPIQKRGCRWRSLTENHTSNYYFWCINSPLISIGLLVTFFSLMKRK